MFQSNSGKALCPKYNAEFVKMFVEYLDGAMDINFTITIITTQKRNVMTSKSTFG